MNATPSTDGAQVAPWCRGSVQARDFPALAFAFRRLERERAKALASAVPAPDPYFPRDPIAEHADLEDDTAVFRGMLARKHVKKARAAARLEAAARRRWADAREGDEPSRVAAEDIHDAVNAYAWHAGRAKGQRERFARVRGCGKRLMIASCRTCGEERRAVPEMCGVSRVCDACDAADAARRRARFGAARGRQLVIAHRYKLFMRKRRGGRFGERMITVTVPHRRLVDSTGEVRKRATDDISARIWALRLAWPVFMRSVRDHWLRRAKLGLLDRAIAYHRAFEWTLGNDSLGHPHFHVWCFSPWVDHHALREWWATALDSVGWPVERDMSVDGTPGAARVVVDVRLLRSFGEDAVHELLKGGIDRRKALNLSRLDTVDGPGLDAFDYADGWTLGEVDAPRDVRAALYMALEGFRTTQGSKGFFEDDDPIVCECCGSFSRPQFPAFRVRFQGATDETDGTAPARTPP